MTDLEKLEASLCCLLGRKFCVYVSSATAGISLALQAAGIQRQKIGLPAGVCVNVPLAVMYSGNTPIYLDHEVDTLGLSPEDLLSSGERFAGVIAVHAYGNPCKMDRIATICRERNSFLIEDLASALGAAIDGCPVGSSGDAAVVSFGAGKVIDVGGGGAVLTDDASLAREISSLARSLPIAGTASQAVDEMSSWHTRIYNDHYGANLNSYAPIFLEKALLLKRGFLHQADPAYASKALVELDQLPLVLQQRTSKWRELADQLEHAAIPGISVHQSVTGTAPWRLNAFVEKGRDAMLKTLLGNNLKASSWFPPSDLFLVPERGDGDGDTPVASRIGREILNFWVTNEVDELYPGQIVKILQAHTQH